MTAQTHPGSTGAGRSRFQPTATSRWLAASLVLGAFAATLLLLPAVVPWTGAANVLAQEKIKEDKATRPVEPSDAKERATVEEAEKALLRERILGKKEMDGPRRFKFNIDPKTPVKELLPTPPPIPQIPGPVLVNDLARVPELSLQSPLPRNLASDEAMKRTAHVIAKINHLNEKKTDAFLEALLGQRGDLAGLPMAMGDACRTTGQRSEQFAQAVRTVRAAQQNGGIGDLAVVSFLDEVRPVRGVTMVRATVPVPAQPPAPPPVAQAPPPVPAPPPDTRDAAQRFWNQYRAACVEEDKGNAHIDRAQQETRAVARIAALMQILAPEPPSVRLGLVNYLAAVSHIEATRALAKLTIFSAEDDVRLAAVDALKVRRERDYTDVLVQGLRYPWPAVAQRASEALVKLERKDLLPQLVGLLDEPDPRAPVVKEVNHKQVPVVRELVRINHHHNCLLCHAPGNTPTTGQEALTAAVPLPSEPLAPPSQGYNNSPSPDILVRLDVTYLHQDFSVLQPVAEAAPWPEMQRFDFLVHNRVLTNQEADAYRAKLDRREPGRVNPYQRVALTALRELTGQDTAPTAEAWRKLLDLPAPQQVAPAAPQ